MEQLLLIYNPTSGTGRAATRLSEIVDVCTKAGWLVTAYPTQLKGDATRIARELGGQYGRVICMGGDGTLSEVAAGLMELEGPPPLGYIPFGSTNDCATTLRLPRSHRQAARVAAATGVPVPADMGLLNGHPFVYVAAFGAFTKVAYDTPQDLKHSLGHLAYILEGIASLPTISPYHLRVEYDGQVLEDDFFFGMVSNTLSIGGMKPPNADQVVLDDGLFEVTLVKKPVSLADVANGFQALIKLAPAEGTGALVQFQARRLAFTADHPLPWTIDGEFGGQQSVNEVVNCQRALRVIRDQ